MSRIIIDNPTNSRGLRMRQGEFDEEWETDFNQQVVDLALRVDKNGNVLPQRVINPTTVKEGEI